MHKEFGSAGAACSIEESSGPQNLRVHIIVLKAQKSEGAKGDLRVCAPAATKLTHTLVTIIIFDTR